MLFQMPPGVNLWPGSCPAEWEIFIMMIMNRKILVLIYWHQVCNLKMSLMN